MSFIITFLGNFGEYQYVGTYGRVYEYVPMLQKTLILSSTSATSLSARHMCVCKTWMFLCGRVSQRLFLPRFLKLWSSHNLNFLCPLQSTGKRNSLLTLWVAKSQVSYWDLIMFFCSCHVMFLWLLESVKMSLRYIFLAFLIICFLDVPRYAFIFLCVMTLGKEKNAKEKSHRHYSTVLVFVLLHARVIWEEERDFDCFLQIILSWAV